MRHRFSMHHIIQLVCKIISLGTLCKFFHTVIFTHVVPTSPLPKGAELITDQSHVNEMKNTLQTNIQ